MNVISFCVYGENPIYRLGMIENLKLIKTVYEHWTPFIYVSSTIDVSLAKTYRELGAQVYQVKEAETGSFMLYRYLPLAEPNVKRVIFRDADSRVNEREFKAVEQWIKEDTELHIMRDHPRHGVQILGGMWGAKSDRLKNIKQLILKYNHLKWDYDVDQHMLRQEIYPLLRHSSTVHDEFFDKKPFPTKRENKEYVGCQFDEHNNLIHPELSEMLINHI